MNTASSLQRTTLWPIAAAALVASATAAAIWVLAPPAGWSACLVLAGAAVAVAAHWVSRQTLHRRLGGDWDDFERLGGDDSSYRRAPEGSLVSILGAKLLQQHGSEAAVKGDVAAIATGVGKLSAQTTQLALSLQIQGNTNRESRDSVHHIDQSIQVVAALARETEGDARQVSDLSLEGEERVNQAAGRMQSIAGAVQESSQQVGQLVEGVEQIGGIANIIKEIAGQTNLLALNAAIEAARAGEQGRGFAVVADEVRKLAERTAKATGEIGTLIARIQADTQAAVEQMEQVTPIIQGGLEQAESAATVLRSIKQQAAGTLEKMGNLSQALAEQSVQATEMVNRVEQMVQVSETTEGMIREASNDSAALEKDVLSLQERVGVAAGAGTGGGAVRPLLTWTDALSTGYAEIDEQHRRLIALGNRLNEAVRSGQERQAAGGVFDELIDYTVNHFKFEEGLMDKHGYVAAEDHKGKHRQLVQDVLAHKARFEKGEALSSELMNFIRDWLVDHIMKTDKLLGRALLAAR